MLESLDQDTLIEHSSNTLKKHYNNPESSFFAHARMMLNGLSTLHFYFDLLGWE